MKFGLTSSLATCKYMALLLTAHTVKFIFTLLPHDVFLIINLIFFVHRSVANDRYCLWKLGITHVLNAAHGRIHCQGSHDFYGSTVDYYGVPADDSPSFDLSRYLFPSAEYIQNALDTAGGKYPSCCFNVTQFYVKLCRPLYKSLSIKSHIHLML